VVEDANLVVEEDKSGFSHNAVMVEDGFRSLMRARLFELNRLFLSLKYPGGMLRDGYAAETVSKPRQLFCIIIGGENPC
jgi:hypothetical protein